MIKVKFTVTTTYSFALVELIDYFGINENELIEQIEAGNFSLPDPLLDISVSQISDRHAIERPVIEDDAIIEMLVEDHGETKTLVTNRSE